MAEKEELTTLSVEQATGADADIRINLTRRPPWQPSPRLPDYLLEDELNKLMDPREWKTYRALWRHSIGLKRTPLITAGYPEISEMTGLSRASIIRSLKGLMKKRYVVRILGPEAKGETREEKARRPKPRDRVRVPTPREIAAAQVPPRVRFLRPIAAVGRQCARAVERVRCFGVPPECCVDTA